MRVYVACGLTHVPRNHFAEYVAFVHALALAIEGTGAEVRYALRDSDPQLASRPISERAKLCYLWDRDMVQWADTVVAEASYPSTGLGIELQIASDRGTPIVLCFRAAPENRVPTVEYENLDHSRHHLQVGDGYVSLMALGVPTIFRVVRYGASEEGLSSVLDALLLLRNPAL